jgi:hypothetical protein
MLIICLFYATNYKAAVTPEFVLLMFDISAKYFTPCLSFVRLVAGPELNASLYSLRTCCTTDDQKSTDKPDSQDKGSRTQASKTSSFSPLESKHCFTYCL